jgi:hypothetical protein
LIENTPIGGKTAWPRQGIGGGMTGQRDLSTGICVIGRGAGSHFWR